MDLVMVRHGQTYCNAEGRHTGWLNYPLNEQGAAQAERAGESARGIAFDRYYCSDLQRTRETFLRVFGERADCHYDARLREINSGFLAGTLYTQCREQYGEEYALASRTWNFRRFDGENMADMTARAQSFLTELSQLPGDVRRVAAVSHAGFIRAVAAVILNAEMPGLPMTMANCAFSVFRLNAQGKWSILFWNLQSLSSQSDWVNA